MAGPKRAAILGGKKRSASAAMLAHFKEVLRPLGRLRRILTRGVVDRPSSLAFGVITIIITVYFGGLAVHKTFRGL